MPLSPALGSQLDLLSSPEKAAIADALGRQVDEQWEPSEAQLAELNRRADEAERTPDSTLPLGEEIRRLRR